MEATQPGQPPAGGDQTPPVDQQAEINAVLDGLSTAVNDAKGRVQADLADLRAQLQRAHDGTQGLDLTVVIQRVTQIEQDIIAIDPMEASVGGPEGSPPPADVPGAPPADVPGGPTPGDQG